MLPIVVLVASCFSLSAQVQIDGERKLWHRLTLTYEGPSTSEDAPLNPFLSYRLMVTFTHARTGKTYWAPGFFAADGRAAETSAASGNKWRVYFTPDEEGEWEARASFRQGDQIAISLDPEAGRAAAFDGQTVRFVIGPTDKTGRDLRRHGLLRYVGRHHLQYAGSGEYYLKAGADSPENFLAYHEFDGTFDADADSASYKGKGKFLHTFAPHVSDWRTGDPVWQGGKGKGIIGALNYLASKSVNSVYFVTYNIDGGDGRDTWMWTSPEVRDRFDVSKLDQWEIVFSHMDRLGMTLHVVQQETENDRALGGSPGLNPVRKLYLREMIARFAHHPAIIWNLGEENNTPDEDRRAIARWIRLLDPYRHPITVHTHIGRALDFYRGLLGDPFFEATSIQGWMRQAHREAVELRRLSQQAGRRWAIFHDEQAPASHGVLPDSEDPEHDEPRIEVLWGNLMGGGSGVEWYFGAAFPHMDINCEDFRSREKLWEQTRLAIEFFRTQVPFWEMEPNDTLSIGAPGVRVLAKGDQLYVVHLPAGGEPMLRLGAGAYQVRWFNPRLGGPLQEGSLHTVAGPGYRRIGRPPRDWGRDWVALVSR